jgi:radical SAM protein with 4Fe4S-binding SPASM domain
MIMSKIAKAVRRARRHIVFTASADRLDRIWFEPVSGCNLHCALCPNSTVTEKRKRGLAKLETFIKVLDETNPKEAELCIWGEPLLHPQITDFFKICCDRNISLYVSSNFNVHADFNKIFSSNPKMELVFSCYGMTQATYELYHRGGNLKVLMDNVMKAIEARKKYGGNLGWIWLKHKYNEKELPKCLEFCEKYGIRPIVSDIRADIRREVLDDISAYKENLQWAAPDSRRYFKNNKRKKKKRKCHLPFRTASFDFDGSVLACCSSYDKEYDMGNINEEPWKDIWNGPKYRSARRAIRWGVFSEPAVICHKCVKRGYRDE